MSDNTANTQQSSGAVQTTGHAWDGDLQEYNNPLPRWWLWCFYGTIVFSILYWFVYPSWPVGDTWIKGTGTVEYTVVDQTTGKEQTKEYRWNTRSLLLEDLGAAATDPQRKAMLAKHPRHLKVLELAAEKAGWGTPLPKGKGRGIAVHESFSSYVAQVAEVSVDARGRLKVERVVCAVDCGLAINPDVVMAQMEGGIGYGLGAILHNAITLKDGQVEQSNFDSYEPLRMDEMPRVEVHIVPSTEPPTGVGEPGVPLVGPAVANAVYAATGQRIRALPFDQVKLRVG